MLKKIAIVSLLLGTLSTPAFCQQISKIAAVVNDEIITTRQLEQRIAGQPGSVNSEAQRLQMLDMMIADLLMEQRSKEIGLEVSDDDIEAAIGDVEQNNNISRDQLEQALLAQGLTMEGYRQQLSRQILRYKLMGREVQSKVDITRQEVRNYFQEHIDDYRQPPKVRLSRLSFPVGEDVDQVKHDAELALRKLQDGQSVDDVLLALSGTTNIEGGEMGSFVAGELSPTFEQALAGLDSGETTPILSLGGLLHILKVEERIPGQVAELSSVEDTIRGDLRKVKMEEKLQQWREELRSEAYVDVRL
ncbi:MAG: SurA N-terminal domain-containing protein [Desulfuromonas sp.]|nr:SurA N-terminal domain-containing protein [Desulfuromonas sp.]